MKRLKTEDRLAYLKDRLQLLAGQINKAKFALEPSGKLRTDFYKLAKEYKRLKLREGVSTL